MITAAASSTTTIAADRQPNFALASRVFHANRPSSRYRPSEHSSAQRLLDATKLFPRGDDQGVKFVEPARIAGKLPLEHPANVFVFRFLVDPAVPEQQALAYTRPPGTRRVRPRRAEWNPRFPGQCRILRAAFRAEESWESQTCASAIPRIPAGGTRRTLSACALFAGSSRTSESAASSRRKGTFSIAAGESNPAARSFVSALSTLFQDVFCVRMAPRIISKRLLPGHQCCGPSAVNKEL